METKIRCFRVEFKDSDRIIHSVIIGVLNDTPIMLKIADYIQRNANMFKYNFTHIEITEEIDYVA